MYPPVYVHSAICETYFKDLLYNVIQYMCILLSIMQWVSHRVVGGYMYLQYMCIL